MSGRVDFCGRRAVSATARHLNCLSDERRHRRLPLVANNVRFLLLPERTVPNFGSVVLSRVLARLSEDCWPAIIIWCCWWKASSIPCFEVYVSPGPERFQGTVYLATGWTEPGSNQGAYAHVAEL